MCPLLGCVWGPDRVCEVSLIPTNFAIVRTYLLSHIVEINKMSQLGWWSAGIYFETKKHKLQIVAEDL